MTAHQRLHQTLPSMPNPISRYAINDNGIDPTPPPKPRAAGGTEPLERATLQLARSIIRLEVSGGIDRQLGAKCLRLCLQLLAKITRMASSPMSAPDALTTLVQIELTLTQLQAALGPPADPTARAALSELERVLQPLVGTYAAMRRRLATLAHAEQARDHATRVGLVCQASPRR